MRMVFITLLILFAGCSDQPTLEELEDRALLTGDWTAVDERKRELRARETLMQEREPCPDNATRVCFEIGMDISCKCMKGSYAASQGYDKFRN